MKGDYPSVIQAKKALWKAFGKSADSAGYVALIEDNLLPGVKPEQFICDLGKGAGGELKGSRPKFCAVHSSSAIAVNTFAPFRDDPSAIVLMGESGFKSLSFEAKLSTGISKPHLDVFLRKEKEVVAVESKLLEYFTPKKAKYSQGYNRENLPFAEECWWQVLDESKNSGKCHLDVAQLVKHYFGIVRLLSKGNESGWKPEKATLIYIFWEPIDWSEWPACQQHRNELVELAGKVEGSRVRFAFYSYSELWEEWQNNPALKDHSTNLKARYFC